MRAVEPAAKAVRALLRATRAMAHVGGAPSGGLVGVLIVALVGVLGGACDRPPDGVESVRRSAMEMVDADHNDLRFALVPPVRLPVQKGDRSRTRIWVELPRGGLIDSANTFDSNGELVGPLELVFPTGTILERVEEVAHAGSWRVADVRGSTLTVEGQRFHLLRPDDTSSEPMLWGYTWPALSVDLDRWVHGAIADGLADGRGLGAMAPPRRLEIAEGVRERGNCMRCHQASRSEDLDPKSIVHRGTDASGFHVPRSIFSGDSALERYRAHDPNAPNEFLRADCDGVPARVVDRGGARRWTCDDGRVPVAYFDVATAYRAGDTHAREVCAGRRKLAQHMTDRALKAVARSLAECDLEGVD